MKKIFVAGGSVTGTDHDKPGRLSTKNNHDAFLTPLVTSNFTIGLVADGCGTGKHSEVGSKIGIKIVEYEISKELSKLSDPDIALDKPKFWQRIKVAVAGQISVLARGMGDDLLNVLENYFLFTIVGFVITKKKTVVFSFGDGMYQINNTLSEIGPFYKNRPPYITFVISGSSAFVKEPELAEFKINEFRNTSEIQQILVGTDGVMDIHKKAELCLPGKLQLVGNVDQFFDFTNPAEIQRRLNVLNRYFPDGRNIRKGVLSDDTTLVLAKDFLYGT